MRSKGIAGSDPFSSERVARAVEDAELMVRETGEAAKRMRDRGLENRVARLCGQARDMFRQVEADPRDLTRARRFLNIYLSGLRDATVKYADLNPRMRDADIRAKFDALVSDMEKSFTTHQMQSLADNRHDLDVEIEVLRERLQQDGLIAR
jgi:5-bromo-4-chloroindolyl phosphate hydrolysis protein